MCEIWKALSCVSSLAVIGNGLIKEWTTYASQFALGIEVEMKAGEYCSLTALAGGGTLESIYWCGYLVLWQAGSLNQGWLGWGKHYTHRPRTPREEASARAKSDQQMQFSWATAIGDDEDDDIMWKWTKWWRRANVEDCGGTEGKGPLYLIQHSLKLMKWSKMAFNWSPIRVQIGL